MRESPNQGLNPQSRQVPWLGIKPATFCFAWQHLINRATSVRANLPLFNVIYIGHLLLFVQTHLEYSFLFFFFKVAGFRMGYPPFYLLKSSSSQRSTWRPHLGNDYTSQHSGCSWWTLHFCPVRALSCRCLCTCLFPSQILSTLQRDHVCLEIKTFILPCLGVLDRGEIRLRIWQYCGITLFALSVTFVPYAGSSVLFKFSDPSGIHAAFVG